MRPELRDKVKLLAIVWVYHSNVHEVEEVERLNKGWRASLRMPPARKQAGVPKQLEGACGGSEIAAHHPDGSNGTPGGHFVCFDIGHFVCFDLGKVGREAVIRAFHCSPWAERRTKWPKLDYFFFVMNPYCRPQ